MARRKLPVAQPKLYKDGRGLWQVTWTDPETGKTVRRGCRTRERKEAEAVMPRIVADAMNPRAPDGYTIGELLDAYATERKQDDHSPTFDYNIQPLRSFFGPLKPHQIKDATFRAYRHKRTTDQRRDAGAKASREKAKREVSDSTAIRELNALRGAISWGRRNGWGGLENLVVHVPKGDTRVRHRYLTQPEAKKLIASCIEPHTALFVRISIATGARMSAVLGLKWDDVTFPATAKGQLPTAEADVAAVPVIDLRLASQQGLDWDDPDAQRFAILAGSINNGDLVAPIFLDLGRGRGNKKRGPGIVSPTNTALYNALVAAYRLRKSDHVIEWRGKPIKKVDLQDAYRRAGIAGATQHTLKHTCCSWLVQSGQSYESIGKFVGTSAKTIEKHYGHLSPQHLATVGTALSLP